MLCLQSPDTEVAGWHGRVVGLQVCVRGERGSSSAVCLHSLRLKWSMQQHSQLNQELETAREPASHVPGLQKDCTSHLALKRKYPTPSGNSFTIQVPKVINATISRILKCKRMTSFLFFKPACLSVFADLFMFIFFIIILLETLSHQTILWLQRQTISIHIHHPVVCHLLF